MSKRSELALDAVRRHRKQKVHWKDNSKHSVECLNFNSETSNELVFSFTTGSAPIRFLNEPLELDYYVAIEGAKDNAGKVTYSYPGSDSTHYFPPYLPCSYIARTTVEFNGYSIYDSGQLGGIYQQAN